MRFSTDRCGYIAVVDFHAVGFGKKGGDAPGRPFDFPVSCQSHRRDGRSVRPAMALVITVLRSLTIRTEVPSRLCRRCYQTGRFPHPCFGRSGQTSRKTGRCRNPASPPRCGGRAEIRTHFANNDGLDKPVPSVVKSSPPSGPAPCLRQISWSVMLIRLGTEPILTDSRLV